MELEELVTAVAYAEETHRLSRAELHCIWRMGEVEGGRICVQQQCPLMVDLGAVEGLMFPFPIP